MNCFQTVVSVKYQYSISYSLERDCHGLWTTLFDGCVGDFRITVRIALTVAKMLGGPLDLQLELHKRYSVYLFACNDELILKIPLTKLSVNNSRQCL